MLRAGLFGKFRKANEKRLPLHPDHLELLDVDICSHLYFEEGYGLPFGVSDADLAALAGGVLSREALFKECDIAIVAKPVTEDFKDMKSGTIHWGWPHCVQQHSITQAAIDLMLTLIAWEEMHYWSETGQWQGHVFHKNNEIAGYAGVHHALNLVGMDGNYGKKLKASVISYGSVSRGAIRGLKSRGVEDISVFTPVGYMYNADKVPDVHYASFEKLDDNKLYLIAKNGNKEPMINALSEADIIVNGILQNTDDPLMFVQTDETDRLKPGCLIADISCDEGMGFPFAIPTNFDNPILYFGKTRYYAVDHTPSYLWNAATWEISKALMEFLPIVMSGPNAWQNNGTIRRAIEIKDGVIQNPKILSFQQRDSQYPHGVKKQ